MLYHAWWKDILRNMQTGEGKLLLSRFISQSADILHHSLILLSIVVSPYNLLLTKN